MTLEVEAESKDDAIEQLDRGFLQDSDLARRGLLRNLWSDARDEAG